jgi:hypothetical protein
MSTAALKADTKKATIKINDLFLSRKLGFWMALSSTICGVLYLLGMGINLITSGSVYPSGSDVRMISSVIALLWNLALLILFAALRREAEPPRAILGEAALVFAILACGASCAAWLSGLIVFPRLAQAADPALAAAFDPYDTASFAYALEHLAWGLFFGLAVVLAALSLRPGWVCWSLLVAGILSLAHFLGVLLDQEALIALGYISWGIALPISSALLAGLFRRELKVQGR